jgi:ATP-dependent protease ClpP protease subunit
MTETSHVPDRKVKYKENGLNQIHEFGLDVASNHIYLFEDTEYDGLEAGSPGVEHRMAGRFIKNLQILQKRSSAPILIHMMSEGGDWTYGMAIYSAIKAAPNHVTILNYANASSMSSIIFCAADRRVMFPHSTFMFHSGSATISGTTKQVATWAADERKNMDTMLRIYVDTCREGARFSGWSDSKIRKWLVSQMDRKEDVILSAEEAVEYGFASAVFGENGKYDWSTLLDF